MLSHGWHSMIPYSDDRLTIVCHGHHIIIPTTIVDSPYYALSSRSDGFEVLVAFEYLEARIAHLYRIELGVPGTDATLGHSAVIAGTQQRHRDVTGPEKRGT